MFGMISGIILYQICELISRSHALEGGSYYFEDPYSFNCHEPVGVANPSLIPLYWLHASDGFAYRGRLHRNHAWVSNKPLYDDSSGPLALRSYAWIQVDLRLATLVTGVQTQGDPQADSWVSSYSVFFSRDCERFEAVHDQSGQLERFRANHDQNSTISVILAEPVIARCVRLVPVSRHGNHTALRLEILGCDARICREAIIMHLPPDAASTSGTLPRVTEPPTRGEPFWGPAGRMGDLRPTLMKRGYAEFKLASEHVVFGLVVFNASEARDRGTSGLRRHGRGRGSFRLTYSRNCHHWEAVRNSRGAGDLMVFSNSKGRFGRSWHTLPYPIRVQCIRIIPDSVHYTAQSPIKAHFIGCGTRPAAASLGPSQTCGLRGHVAGRHHGSVVQRVRRVIGGNVTSRGEWPWLVSLQIREPEALVHRHVCGGSLIHSQWVLTALHCITIMYDRLFNNGTIMGSSSFEPSNEDFLANMRVVLGRYDLDSESRGSSTGVETRAEAIISHPEYNGTYFVHDIALVKLARPVQLSDHISLVCLPDPSWTVDRTDDRVDDTKDGTHLEDTAPSLQLNHTGAVNYSARPNCLVVGWGALSEHGDLPSRPRHTSLRLFPFDECQRIFSHLNLTTDMLCAGHLDGSADACFGDSGGPMMCERDGRWHQLGVVSWNIGCALEGFPGVYASVQHHLAWIEDVIKNGTTADSDAP